MGPCASARCTAVVMQAAPDSPAPLSVRCTQNDSPPLTLDMLLRSMRLILPMGLLRAQHRTRGPSKGSRRDPRKRRCLRTCGTKHDREQSGISRRPSAPAYASACSSLRARLAVCACAPATLSAGVPAHVLVCEPACAFVLLPAAVLLCLPATGWARRDPHRFRVRHAWLKAVWLQTSRASSRRM